MKTLYVFLIIIFLSATSSLFGQFSVISTTPSHGDVGVDTASTLTITFNSAVDSSARFPFPQDFFMNLWIKPDSLISEPDSITLSPDMKTVYIHNLHLTQDVQYFFVIVNAVSQSGDSLSMPYSIEFTTGGSLPTASVSGTINFPSDDPAGAIVVLFDGDLFGEEGYEKFVALVPNSSGNYTVDYVEPGTYWPAAVKNVYIDQWGELELKDGSGLGFYDVNADFMADSITVASGSTITNIDFSLLSVFYQTAGEPFPAIELLAQTWAPDAIPVLLSAPMLKQDGTALFWWYAFYSPSLTSHRAWFEAGDLLAITDPAGLEADTIPVPQNWLDSDTIMAIAEEHGGAGFRQEFPDAEAAAMLGHLNFEDNSITIINNGSEMPTNKFLENKIVKSISEFTFGSSANNLNQLSLSLPAIWMVQYTSYEGNTDFAVIIDAITGAVLSDPVTASVAEAIAFPIAQNWSSDAKLWSIGTQAGGLLASIDQTGKSQVWGSIYYSQSLDSLFVVILMGQLPVYSGNTGWTTSDTITVTPGWLDSDVTIAVAEALGGETYRQNNQDVNVYAQLSRWFHGQNPALSVWEFDYTSSTSDTLVFLINAHTGNIVGIDETELNYLPDDFALYQNYPNPFNPATIIKYDLPHRSFVQLKIYDVLGNEISTLVNEEEPAGKYKVEFDATGLPSGVYFYRLKAGDFTNTRKMILLR